LSDDEWAEHGWCDWCVFALSLNPLQRQRKLSYVRTLHSELDGLHARTAAQRATLNLLLDGAWKPHSLSALHLRNLMQPQQRSRQQAQPSKQQAAASDPLNLHAVVCEWNDSLAELQAMLSAHLQSSDSRSGAPSYLSTLADANATVQAQASEHASKLSHLRALSQHLRDSLLPELEHDLALLQRQLTQAGTYSGPIIVPSTPSHKQRPASSPQQHSRKAQAPGLLPPTPFHSNQPHTSLLAVPQTPAAAASSSSNTASGRIHFTPSNIVRQ